MRFPKLLAILLFVSCFAHAQTSPVANFVGKWVGVLEYRDFTTNELVKLPTWLTVTPGATPNKLLFTYTYDDGPTKTVIEQSTITLDPAAKTWTIASGNHNSGDTYQIDPTSLANFLDKGRGTLTLSGTGTENSKSVDVRITIRLGRNIYFFTKQTRPTGGDFTFRDGYTFTRAETPVSR
jgi:hypothetical protein